MGCWLLLGCRLGNTWLTVSNQILEESLLMTLGILS